jgi:hypothetical protein
MTADLHFRCFFARNYREAVAFARAHDTSSAAGLNTSANSCATTACGNRQVRH